MLGHVAIGRRALGKARGAVPALVLIAEAGSYILIGVAVAPIGRSDAGSYLLSGQDAVLGASVSAAAGSYSLTGRAALFSASMASAQGSYALSGQAALFSLSVPCAPGSYSLSGMVVTHPISLLAATGTYTITGIAAEIHRNIFGGFAGEGEGEGEFVGTTGYTLMLEDPDVLLTYAAELRLRSLS